MHICVYKDDCISVRVPFKGLLLWQLVLLLLQLLVAYSDAAAAALIILLQSFEYG